MYICKWWHLKKWIFVSRVCFCLARIYPLLRWLHTVHSLSSTCSTLHAVASLAYVPLSVLCLCASCVYRTILVKCALTTASTPIHRNLTVLRQRVHNPGSCCCAECPQNQPQASHNTTQPTERGSTFLFVVDFPGFRTLKVKQKWYGYDIVALCCCSEKVCVERV